MYCISKEDHVYIKVRLEILKSISRNFGYDQIRNNALNLI